MDCLQCGSVLDNIEVSEASTCTNCGDTCSFVGPPPRNTADELAKVFSPGRFALLDVVGKGGFGVVYKARDTELDRNVAIKRPRSPSESMTELFYREAKSTSNLTHPNIARVYDVRRFEDSCFIVSEFVEGVTMGQWLREQQPSLEQTCKVCQDICGAVSEAHARGVLHRDLKPGNVLIGPDNSAKVLDFGLAFQPGGDDIVVPGVPVGTPAFMSPEQVRGDTNAICPATDVYAIGVILYFAATGILPFRDGCVDQLYDKIKNQEAPPPYDVDRTPYGVSCICAKAMRKESSSRYQSAAELSADLDRWLNFRRPLAQQWISQRELVNRRTATITGTLATVGFAAWGLNLAMPAKAPESPIGERKRKVRLDAGRPDVQLQFFAVDPLTGLPSLKPTMTCQANETIELLPGNYRVRVSDGDEFLDVYREVPRAGQATVPVEDNVILPHRNSRVDDSDGAVLLNQVTLIPLAKVIVGMSKHEVTATQPPASFDKYGTGYQQLRDFYLDCNVVTEQQLANVLGITVPSGTTPSAPATKVTYNKVLAYAELSCKTPMSLWEYLWAATNGYTTDYPWSNDSMNLPWVTTEPAFFDSNLSTPPVQGLLSGYGEWTETPFYAAREIFERSGDQLPDPNAYRFIVGIPIQMKNGGPPVDYRDTVNTFKFGTERIDDSRIVSCLRCSKRL